MSDLISRKAVIEKMKMYCETQGEFSLSHLFEIIMYAPPVEPPKGEWKQRTDFDADNNAIFECSNCLHGDVQGKGSEVPFCWYCGADMRGKK